MTLNYSNKLYLSIYLSICVFMGATSVCVCVLACICMYICMYVSCVMEVSVCLLYPLTREIHLISSTYFLIFISLNLKELSLTRTQLSYITLNRCDYNNIVNIDVVM